MTRIYDADVTHLPLIQSLAEEIWWPTYSPIVSTEQIRFMLDEIYSIESLQKSIVDQSQQFILLEDENGPQGFAAYGPFKDSVDVMKLHKLYIRPNNQGKGYGKMLVDEIKKRSIDSGKQTLLLNVNRYNSAKAFYEKIGFTVIREEDVPVGKYWMNDFVLETKLK